MIRYWSVWNFFWWLNQEYKGKKFEGPLKTSIFMCSTIGGFFMHVYPRTFTPRLGSYEFKFPKWKLIIGDLLIHQFPLYRMIRQNYTSNVCGIYLLLPALTNISITKLRPINADQIYGIKYKHVIISCLGVFSDYGMFSHKKHIVKYIQASMSSYGTHRSLLLS